MYPALPLNKATFVDQCPIEKVSNFTVADFAVDEHEGILALYHISFLLVPVTGFVISLVVGGLSSVFVYG